jgi:hypothetical protein
MRRDQLIKFQAGTLMHELGHTFGLDHGGPNPDGTCDPGAPSAVNRKPNYISVMQYALQTTGIRTAAATCSTAPIPPNPRYAQLDPGEWRVDYSSLPFHPLDENSLLETEGISSCACGTLEGSRDISVAYASCGGLPMSVPACGPVDWNRNGTLDPVPLMVDINQDSLDDATVPCPFTSPLLGFDDWTFVKTHMAFQCGGNFNDGTTSHLFPATPELHEEMLLDTGPKACSSR